MLTDERVNQLRAEHGWAKETIRAIEREVIRAMTCPRCLGDKTRCPMEQPVRVRDLGARCVQLLDDPFALTRQYQACRPYLEEQAQVPEKVWKATKPEPWVCLLCTSPIRGQHWNLQDGSPCPNGTRSPLPATRSDDRDAR